MKKFDAYIALGDSMSIDLYPALDLQQDEHAPLGAASLLFQNDQRFWPEFKGKDLKSINPNIQFAKLAQDGATTWDLMDDTYLTLVRPWVDQSVLITLTIGGNDALRLVRMENPTPAQLESEVAGILQRTRMIVSKLRETFKHATIILNTVYDPTDGSGHLPPMPSFKDKLRYLDEINSGIRKIGSDTHSLIADVHKRFLGHGLTAPEGKRFYWTVSPIEPSALGASHLRAIWWELLTEI
jgi:hypothetical protein